MQIMQRAKAKAKDQSSSRKQEKAAQERELDHSVDETVSRDGT